MTADGQLTGHNNFSRGDFAGLQQLFPRRPREAAKAFPEATSLTTLDAAALESAEVREWRIDMLAQDSMLNEWDRMDASFKANEEHLEFILSHLSSNLHL